MAAASAPGRPQLDAAYLAAVGMAERVAAWREAGPDR
jgi:hypothetical protein